MADIPLQMLQLCFHPVGQGLFCSGQIRSFESSASFNWVYDCGTSPSQDLVKGAIARLNSAIVSETLDLVVVSHFDRDHVSGLVHLLNTFKIKTLLLPYMPLWQRLYCAFVEGVDTQDALMGVFIDPVAYVLALREDDRIEQIVLVPPSTKPPSTDLLGASEEGVAPEGGGVSVTFDFDDSLDDKEKLGQDSKRLKWLKENGKIALNGWWEFLPYNDAKFQPADADGFRDAVEDEADKLVRLCSDEEWKSALKKLKSIYDNEFGKSSFKRNVISLFLYGGPIGAVRSVLGPCQSTCFSPWIAHPFIWEEFRHFYSRNPKQWPCTIEERREGFLMTGDGYLDTPERLQALVKYFGPSGRLSKISALQVMHHGSNKNWHKGVAAALSPDHSIFSSDPNHKGFGHPNRDVVEDFICYGPQQVDSWRGFSLSAILWKGKQ